MDAFARELAAATGQAMANAVERDLRIAGVPIRLRASDPDLLAALTLALEHHAGPAQPAARINVWSSVATGVPRPVLPEAVRERIVGRRADLAPGAAYQLDYDPAARMLTLMDPATGDVDICLHDLAHLPHWERAAPLRSALGWILRRHDRHLLHAAAVSDAGGAALLLGAGGAGKSTASLRCREAGMGFLGDDICAVSPGESPRVYNVYGTAKAVWADHGRFPEFDDLLITDPADFGYKAVYAVNRAAESRIVAEADLRVLLLVDRRLPVGSVQAVSPAVAVTLVAGTTSSFLPGSGRPMLTALSDIARRLPVLRISLGEAPDRVAELVRAAIRDPQALLEAGRAD